MTMAKNYKILKKMLENDGFVLVRESNHALFIKDGKTVLVTKNIKHPQTIFKKTLSMWARG